MSFDRLTPYAVPLSAPPPTVITFEKFRRMVRNMMHDSDDWLSHVKTAYNNVPPHSPKHEYDIAVQTAVRSIESRKGVLNRPKRAGTVPALSMERREGGDDM